MINQHTTYYLGAGASANALPLANNMKEDIINFLDLFNPNHYSSALQVPKFDKELFSRYLYAISDLDTFSSIDYYAKTLDHRKDRTKRLLLSELVSIYLIFKQFGSKRIDNKYIENINSKITFGDKCFDNRYLSFLTKIYNENLNNNVNVITWNYDNQFEIALSKMLGLAYFNAKEQLNIYPNRSGSNFTSTENAFKLIKLNGSADLWFNKYYENINFQDDIDFDGLIEMSLKKKIDWSSIACAWDSHQFQKDAIEISNQIIKNTESLIIIGYSFPDFNWEVDKIIFEGNNIEEIFIQVPNVDYVEIKDKLQKLVGKEINVQHYSNLRDFYLPIHTNPTERIFNSKSTWIDN